VAPVYTSGQHNESAVPSNITASVPIYLHAAARRRGDRGENRCHYKQFHHKSAGETVRIKSAFLFTVIGVLERRVKSADNDD
jgi:hypothetical protein